MIAKFNIVKRGYSIDEVDEHIEALENIIKSYKEKDAAIKNAIINAQVAADNIIKTAEDEAYEIKRQTGKKLDRIAGTIERQRDFIKDFEKDYSEMINKYLHAFERGDMLKVCERLNELEEHISMFNNDRLNVYYENMQINYVKNDEDQINSGDEISKEELESITNVKNRD